MQRARGWQPAGWMDRCLALRRPRARLLHGFPVCQPREGVLEMSAKLLRRGNRVMVCRALLVTALLLMQAFAADSAELPLIPMPQRVEPGAGSFDVNAQTKLMVGDQRTEEAARYF